MEASALPPSVALARTRLALGAPLLRLRSDEQLVSLFRGGSEEAFRAIHDRYRQRMFAYTRQMLTGSAVDAEDAVQEIFVRAYSGLRSSDRELALRAWLYRIAHNRCIDELRRPQSVATETIPATVPNAGGDPVVRLEQRDALKRLIADVQRLPDQQRSALLMRELAGMTYADVAGALGVSVAAVKSLLVRARVGLAQANEARDTSCARIREDLIVSHDRGVRASGLARRHLRDCPHCRQFRSEVRGVSRQLAGFVPALGPIGVIAKVLGIGGGGGAAAGTGAIAGSGASATATATAAATTAAGGLASAGGVVGLGAIAGSGHVVTLLAAAVVTAGGAIELQHMSPPAPQRIHHHHVAVRAPSRTPQAATSSAAGSSAQSSSVSQASSDPSTSTAAPASTSAVSNPLASNPSSTGAGRRRSRASVRTAPLAPPLTETLDPDQLTTLYGPGTPPSLINPADPTATPVTSTPSSTPSADGSSSAPPTNPTAPASSTGTASSTPVSTAPTSTGGTASTGTTGTGTASSGTTGTSGTNSTSTGSSSTGGSSTSTGSTGGSGGTGKVTPAASTRSIDPSKLSAASRPHGHGTIAVFTMTGN